MATPLAPMTSVTDRLYAEKSAIADELASAIRTLEGSPMMVGAFSDTAAKLTDLAARADRVARALSAAEAIFKDA